VAGLAAKAGFELRSLNVVMAGLDPAIHDFLLEKQDVDARHKAGHDEEENAKGRERSRPFFDQSSSSGLTGRSSTPRLLGPIADAGDCWMPCWSLSSGSPKARPGGGA
jgi:hypothetical protein